MAVLEAPSQDRRNRPLVVIAAVALLAAAACVWLLLAMRPGPAAAPPAGPAGVGDTVEFTTADGTTGAVTLIGIRRTTDRAPDSRLAPGPVHGSFLVADFGVKVTQGQILVAAHNFQVEMGGRVYAQNPVPTPTQISATARPGHAAEGPVGFDAPTGTMRITFNDASGPLATFTVDG